MPALWSGRCGPWHEGPLEAQLLLAAPSSGLHGTLSAFLSLHTRAFSTVNLLCLWHFVFGDGGRG